MGTAMKTDLRMPRQARTSVLRPAARPTFSSATSLLAQPGTPDTFIRTQVAADPAKQAATNLKSLLSALSRGERKAAMAYLTQQSVAAQGKKSLLGEVSALESRLSESKLAETHKTALKEVAATVQQLSAQDKVQFVRVMTGEQSAFAKMAEAVLIQGVNPTFRETLMLFRPQVNHWTLSGFNAAFASLAMGLLVMPLVLPTLVVFNPTLLGQAVIGIGLALL